MGQKPKHRDVKVDFNAAALLDSHLQSATRRHTKGITIDRPDARILDDGFFIARRGDGWVVDVSIADVPSMIPEQHRMEYAARKLGYERSARQRLFPYDFLLKYVSLQDGQKRPAVTFTITLDRDLNIQSYGAARTIFENLKQCNDRDVTQQLDARHSDVKMWVDLGKRLYAKRMTQIGRACDRAVANDNVALPSEPAVHDHPGREGGALVHEMMRLANLVATQFLKDKGLDAPFKNASGVIDIVRVSADFNFDQECNRMALDAVAGVVHTMPSYAHISSPMREYRDFLGLKIIGRHLDGHAPHEGDQAQARRLCDNFNARAAHPKIDLLSPEWKQAWSQYRAQQSHSMPHPREQQDPATHIGSLRAYCKEQGWRTPKRVERRLMINGAHVTLSGLRCGEAGGLTSWAVHHNPDCALELAAARMKNAIAAKSGAQLKCDPL